MSTADKPAPNRITVKFVARAVVRTTGLVYKILKLVMV